MKKAIHKHQKYHKQHQRKNLLYAIWGLAFTSVFSVFAISVFTTTTSALTYQNTVPQTFTLNESLSILLSSSDLTIDELIPGQSSDSNIVTVTVLSNNAYGYDLSANTGNSTYNTTDLVNKAGFSDVFTSLSPSASIDDPSNFNNNTWGFNYCDYNNTSSCSNWNNYSGLPLYSAGANKELKTTTTVSAPAGDKLDVKIAAKASLDQLGGEYNNVVNFIAVGHPAPYYMQNVASWKDTLTTGQEVTAIDTRDNKTYTVAKMADGNIWMNQNLDLCIGCNGTAALTSENTDLNESGTGIYTEGYSRDSSNKIIWAPDSTAVTSGRTISGTTVSGWTNDYNEPYSAEGGDVYYYTSGSTSVDTTYNSLSACTAANHTEAECKHYHRGNYYNWTAAIASNASSSISTQYNVAANSICPKGWRLPKGMSSSSVTATTAEFANLLYTGGVIANLSDNNAYASGGFNKIRSTPLYLVRSGDIGPSTLDYSASRGYYWSSTVDSSIYAYYLVFYGNVNPRYSHQRYRGRSVRCLAR